MQKSSSATAPPNPPKYNNGDLFSAAVAPSSLTGDPQEQSPDGAKNRETMESAPLPAPPAYTTPENTIIPAIINQCSAIDKAKVKTVLCLNYMHGRQCVHGCHCAFAHGVEELRKQPLDMIEKKRAIISTEIHHGDEVNLPTYVQAVHPRSQRRLLMSLGGDGSISSPSSDPPPPPPPAYVAAATPQQPSHYSCSDDFLPLPPPPPHLTADPMIRVVGGGRGRGNQQQGQPSLNQQTMPKRRRRGTW